MTEFRTLDMILHAVVAFISAILGVWAFSWRMQAARDQRTRELIKQESPSEERVRDLARQEATNVFTQALTLSRTATKLDMRELLAEHEVKEDDRLVRAIRRVEQDAEKSLEGFHETAQRVTDLMGKQEKRLAHLASRLAVMETNVARLLEREHMPSASIPKGEPDSSKP